MTDKELTLIREAAFSSPELSSNTQGCRHGRLYQDLDHHVPDCSIWAIEGDCIDCTHPNWVALLEIEKGWVKCVLDLSAAFFPWRRLSILKVEE